MTSVEGRAFLARDVCDSASKWLGLCVGVSGVHCVCGKVGVRPTAAVGDTALLAEKPTLTTASTRRPGYRLTRAYKPGRVRTALALGTQRSPVLNFARQQLGVVTLIPTWKSICARHGPSLLPKI